MSIIVSHLSKKYGAQKAVDDISFELHKGEIVGFLGPNGAGKSTTMKMITGYLSSDSGEILVGGIQVSPNNIVSKQKIGYLPESNPLYYDMFVREYLLFRAGVYDIENKYQKIESTIALIGLSSEANKKIGELSKGYKQRVGLAAALLHNPEVLILDEPTTGLDPNQIIEIREIIKKLGKEKTILFSTHIMQEVEAICDRVIIINKGSIVANATLQELQKNKNNHHLVQVSFKQKIDVKKITEIEDVLQLDEVNEYTFHITTNHPDNIKRELLSLSLKEKLDIVSLQSHHQNLEHIFKSLTH